MRISNVHIRFEDPDEPEGAYAIGVTLRQLSFMPFDQSSALGGLRTKVERGMQHAKQKLGLRVDSTGRHVLHREAQVGRKRRQ